MAIHNDAEILWNDLQKQMPADVVDGLNAGWQEIMDAKLVDRCLKVGSRAPEFSLPSATGKIVSLKQQLARGPVVLTFYRGVWCPFCNLALQTYQRSLDRITAKGASLMAISPQTPDFSLTMQEKNALTFEVLSDQGSRISAQYGLKFETPQSHQKILAQFDMPLSKVNGDAAALIPVPATYVINRDGRIVWAHIDPNYRNRAEVDELLAALDELQR
jgi:peroxiredoxin